MKEKERAGEMVSGMEKVKDVSMRMRLVNGNGQRGEISDGY
jgi:hypothetical protein